MNSSVVAKAPENKLNQLFSPFAWLTFKVSSSCLMKHH